MSDIEKDTENKILDAAREVFIKKGMDGTRMQEIADEAGINKALLHYYFRNKELLFKRIFQEAFKSFIPKAEALFLSEIPFFEKIKLMVSNYINLLRENEFIPAFILQEINRNPDSLYEIMKQSELKPQLFLKVFDIEIQKGTIKNIPPQHLVVNLLALCIFPFAAKPMMQRIFFENNQDLYNTFIDERKTYVADYIINAIKA